MSTTNFSACTRCGKQRVFVKTYQEMVGTSSVSYTETTCPDKNCQELVDKTLLAEEQRRAQYNKPVVAKVNPGNTKKIN